MAGCHPADGALWDAAADRYTQAYLAVHSRPPNPMLCPHCDGTLPRHGQQDTAPEQADQQEQVPVQGVLSDDGYQPPEEPPW